MLKIIIEHNEGKPYKVEVECSKPIKHIGSNIVPNVYDIVDIVEDSIHEYRSG